MNEDDRMAEPTAEKLNEIATAVTTVIYEMGEEYSLSLPDLAGTMIAVAGNVAFAAWQGGAVEQFRNAADLFERELLKG
jgi:hypothetical protein